MKLPSDASKRRNGTRADFERQATKLEATAHAILQRHRAADSQAIEPPLDEKPERRVERLDRDAAELRGWLARNPEDRRGPKGTLRQSNRTDNESARMATSKGVIQGYTGAAAVDARHQIVVEAQAHGTGSEQEILLPVVEALHAHALLTTDSLDTADAGYHSEADLRALEQQHIEALNADAELRKRDERFATQGRHRAKKNPLHDKSRSGPSELRQYQPADFTCDPEARMCVCPAGKSLYRKGRNLVIGQQVGDMFRGANRDCFPCTHRARCLRHPERTLARQVVFFHDRVAQPPLGRHASPETATQRMKARIDLAENRDRYAARFGVVEPVFGNLCHKKGLRRFTLRGQVKVDGQWKLFCLVHNVEKLAKPDTRRSGTNERCKTPEMRHGVGPSRSAAD